jgi:hypothetical protein
MRDYEREGIQPETALEALREMYANPDLTKFVQNFIGPNPPTRKEDMLAVLVRLLEGEGLGRTWAMMPLIHAAIERIAGAIAPRVVLKFFGEYVPHEVGCDRRGGTRQ